MIKNSRIDNQRQETNALLSFFKEKIGYVFALAGLAPLFINYFGLLPSPAIGLDLSNSKYDILKVASLITSLVSGVTILYLYGERNKFYQNGNKKRFEWAGIFFTILGLGLFAFYILVQYKTESDYIKSNYKKLEEVKKILKEDESYLKKLPVDMKLSIIKGILEPDNYNDKDIYTIESPIIHFSVIYKFGIGLMILLSLRALINLWINSIKINSYYIRRRNEVEIEDDDKTEGNKTNDDKIKSKALKLLDSFKTFMSKNNSISSLKPSFLTYCLIGYVLIYHLIFGFDYSDVSKPIKLDSKSVVILDFVAYIGFYPCILLGAGFLFITSYYSFENKNNFLVKVDALESEYYDYVEKIVGDILSVTDRHQQQKQEDKELFKNIFQRFFASQQRDISLLFEKYKWQKNVEMKVNQFDNIEQVFKNIQYKYEANKHRRFFIEASLKRVLKVAHQKFEDINIDEKLIVSGKLIDEIIDIMPINKFKAVSWSDLKFWASPSSNRYLDWNKRIIEDGRGSVTRIFILKEEEINEIKDPSKNKDYLEAFKKQIKEIGIKIIIGTNKIYDDIEETDFGIYQDLGVSFFEKEDSVGGRSFKMLFDPNELEKYNAIFEKIKANISEKSLKLALEEKKYMYYPPDFPSNNKSYWEDKTEQEKRSFYWEHFEEWLRDNLPNENQK